ncbi:Zinc finger protein 296 [Myotis davidii]|uniref:Zinc finger protein 296 n=1 Tax=Myotis davidii TaxID=225400 RepID=L5LMF9_MYODS|nr:Zinc finger protein 296 [Myotis davidii]
MEMGDLVINVKPEPPPWPLQATGLQRGSPKEVPEPDRLEGAPHSCPTPVPAAAHTLLALGLQNQSAPWTSLVPHPHDRQPWTDKHRYSSKLNRHRLIHGLGPGGARFECPHCRVPFRLRATLGRHLWQKHPKMPFPPAVPGTTAHVSVDHVLL